MNATANLPHGTCFCTWGSEEYLKTADSRTTGETGTMNATGVRLSVERSIHGLPSVQMTGATPAQMRVVRSAVLRNHMADPVYHLHKTAGAFLQGYEEESGWLLVEFWAEDATRYRPFVDYLNDELAKAA